MAKARKLPSGNWRCRVYIGKDEKGNPRYKSFTAPDKKRCERMASQYADENRSFTDGVRFRDAMESYILSRKAVLSPATIRGYRNIQKALRNDFSSFCERSVTDITQDVYQTLVNTMVERGVSPKTVRNRTGFISSVIKYKGYMPPNIKLPDKVKSEHKIPDLADVLRIVSEAEGTEMEIPILLAAFAPMRRSEIVALEMSDIDGNVIHVQRAVVMNENGDNVSKSPKTYDSDRYILMPDSIMDKIRKKGYITNIKNPQHISQKFEHIARRAGCPGTRFHDLRHFCASYLHAKGIPEQYILERGGWTTDGVMKKIYRHSLSAESDKINKNLVKMMDDVL